jgi:hypothetical protein
LCLELYKGIAKRRLRARWREPTAVPIEFIELSRTQPTGY